MIAQNAILEALQAKRSIKDTKKGGVVREAKFPTQAIKSKKWINVDEGKAGTLKKPILPKSRPARLSEAAHIPLSDLRIIIFADGDRYIGELNDEGLPHGYGTLVNADGSVYAGEFVCGDAHGLGTYFWTDGVMYNGYWAGGNRNGRGAFFIDGEIHNGEWENGTLKQLDSEVCEKMFFIKKQAKIV